MNALHRMAKNYFAWGWWIFAILNFFAGFLFKKRQWLLAYIGCVTLFSFFLLWVKYHA